MSHDDRKLALAFATLRSQDADRTPSFSRVLARPRSREAGLWRWAPAISAGFLGVAVALSFQPPPQPQSVWSWTAPTDALLDVELEAGLYDEVPRFSADAWSDTFEEDSSSEGADR